MNSEEWGADGERYKKIHEIFVDALFAKGCEGRGMARYVLVYGDEVYIAAMQNLLRDFGYTLRQLRRSPGFALTTILTLTMAIAANVIVFGIVNALLFHPLPAAHSDQLFQVQGKDSAEMTVAYPNYQDIRDRNQTFSDVAIFRLARIGMGVDGTAQPVWAYEASGNYFGMLGVKPLLGRFFGPAEDAAADGSPVAVLSYACWKVRFGGDAGIVGRTVALNKHPYTVLGVAPEGFNGTERFIWPEIWVPMQNQMGIEGHSSLKMRGNSNSWVVGRLKSGVTAQQADADLGRIAVLLAKEHPLEDQTLKLRVSKPGLLGDALGGPVKGFLGGVMLLALLVLVAACANLGGLFAARTADRARELGIRIAIGSSRAGIARQLFTEALTISVLGGVTASLLAAALLRALSNWRPPHVEIPVQFQVQAGTTMYLFAGLLTLLTALVFGMIPARQVWKTDPNETLKASGASVGEGRLTLRSVLLVVQVALCCLLVTASFVAVRGLQRTFAMPLGVQPVNVTVATLDLHLAGYQGDDVERAQERLLSAVEGIPGVTGAAYASTTPLSVNQSNEGIYAPGTTDFNQGNVKFDAADYSVSPGYFAVAGTRLVAGRVFTEHDDAHAPRVAIVNETFARQLFGTVNAVGKRYPTGNGGEIEVVGVVEDGKYTTLTEDASPVVFWPILQSGNNDTVLLARSERSSPEMVEAIGRAIAGVDSSIPIFTLSSWTDALSLATVPARLATIALGVLGALAMMLAVTGVFGLANYTVSRRMRELGIRMALGAQGRQVLGAALGRIAWLLGIGSMAGLALGVAASKLLASIVYQATAADPAVIFAVVATMAALGLGAAAIPARRALKAEPAMLLRDE